MTLHRIRLSIQLIGARPGLREETCADSWSIPPIPIAFISERLTGRFTRRSTRQDTGSCSTTSEAASVRRSHHCRSAKSTVLYVGAHRHKEPGGFFKSTDGGLTWRESPELKNEAVHSLTQSESDPNILLAGTFNGIFRSDDSGESGSSCLTSTRTEPGSTSNRWLSTRELKHHLCGHLVLALQDRRMVDKPGDQSRTESSTTRISLPSISIRATPITSSPRHAVVFMRARRR